MTLVKDQSEGVILDIQVMGQGPALIFIHGWAASQRFWRFQLPFFTQKYRVLTYDLRGHGNSDKPKKGYAINDHVNDLKLVMARHNIQQPILIGHSLGGMIALQYTLENPTIPRAIVLVGASPYPVSSWKVGFQFRVFGLMLRLSRSRASQYTKERLFAPDPDPELVEWVNTDSLRTPTHVVLASIKAVRGFDVVDRLQEVSVPTALIRGEFDSALEMSVLEDMVKVMPRAQRTVITGAGHNCMLEQPESFNSAVASFLRQVL